MGFRATLLAALAALALTSGCRDRTSGPIGVSAIGGAPELVNPNLVPLSTPSAMLAEGVAQPLVRFDRAGQIEPALAQSWIVSDDGLRYTFRLARTRWADGSPVTAQQVAARIRATLSRSSRNRLKPLLGAITDVEAMTDTVLEIALRAPRPNLLQLLAQPEMAIIRNNQGTGPFRAEEAGPAAKLLQPIRDEEDEEEPPPEQSIVLRGESAAMAVARFQERLSDFVTSGTAGDLPIARAAQLPGGALRFDPVSGLLGLQFLRADGRLADPAFRAALSMAVDRDALAAALGVPELQPRLGIVAPGVEELPAPALPAWAADPLPVRRERAAAAVQAAAAEGAPAAPLRVAVPDQPGYRLIFAHLRRDWRLVGVEVEIATSSERADLALVDTVAPANLATWYLRRFGCGAYAVCSPEADALLDDARNTPNPAERQARIAGADRVLNELTPFIPLTAPVRWSLVGPRLTGFQPNPFARHFVGSLLAARR